MQHYEKSKNFLGFGLIFFKLGIFFLASAPIISCLFLITSLFISFLFNKNIFKNRWDYPFLICIPLMIIGSLINYSNILNSIILNGVSNPYLPIIGLANWIPFFLCFVGFEVYLNSNKKKRDCIILFLSSTIPLIFSGFVQYWFGWSGPFSILNGLIIWYQRPLVYGEGITGFFNNSNYAGLWLIMIIPFCIGLLQEKSHNIYSRLFIFFTLSSLCVCVVLTNSRSAWGGMVIALILMFISKGKVFLVFLISLFMTLLIRILSLFLDSEGNFLFKAIIPPRVLNQFRDIGLQDPTSFTRIDIWNYAIDFIKDKPFWGWGSGIFPFLLENESTYWRWHSHNLILELALSFGLVITSIIVITVFLILIKSLKILMRTKRIVKKISILKKIIY